MSNMVLSNSKAKTYRRCPKQFEYKYVQRLRPKTKKVQLERGSWLHECLMYHYDGMDWREPHQQFTDTFNEQFEETKEEWGDLPSECSRILKAYFRHYRDVDCTYTTVDSELDETLTLPNGLKFRFIIDHIYEDSTGSLWLRDHKTVKTFMDHDYLTLDSQLTRYFWAAKHMGYTPLAGIEFNEIRTKPPTIPKLLKKGGLSRAKNIDTDYWTYLAAIKKHKLNPQDYRDILRRLWAQEDKFFKRTRLPQNEGTMRIMMKDLVHTAQQIQEDEQRGRFPRTSLKSCTYDCDYLDLCSVQLQGGDGDSIIRHNFNRTPERLVVE